MWTHFLIACGYNSLEKTLFLPSSLVPKYHDDNLLLDQTITGFSEDGDYFPASISTKSIVYYIMSLKLYSEWCSKRFRLVALHWHKFQTCEIIRPQFYLVPEGSLGFKLNDKRLNFKLVAEAMAWILMLFLQNSCSVLTVHKIGIVHNSFVGNFP